MRLLSSLQSARVLGSAREMLSCLEVAEAFGYVGPIEPALRAEFNRIIGTLVRLVERSA